MREEFEEIEVTCPKCGTKEKVRASNEHSTIYQCMNCKELINVPKIKKK